MAEAKELGIKPKSKEQGANSKGRKEGYILTLLFAHCYLLFVHCYLFSC